jgi:zinc-binding alcohol dehydrogenase/oxidoreductase
MRAAVIHQVGGPTVFRIEEVADPAPGPGEVVVDLRAASVNRRDRSIRAGVLKPRTIGGQGEGAVSFPLILGSDGAGVVSELGAGVESVEAGDEVIINPSLNWGDSDQSPGPGWETLGVPRQGTYAERIAVPADFVARKPAHMSWAEAAALPLGGLTAWRAVVSKGKVSAGGWSAFGAPASPLSSYKYEIHSNIHK